MKKSAQGGAARAGLGVFVALALALSACGGGGDAGQSPGFVADATDLEGTWVGATDGNTIGSACTNTPVSDASVRETFFFTGNKYVIHIEQCQSSGPGAQGQYVFMTANIGRLSIGLELADSLPGGVPARELDLFSARGNLFTVFRLVGNALTLANNTEPGHDGRTAETRITGFLASATQFKKQ